MSFTDYTFDMAHSKRYDLPPELVDIIFSFSEAHLGVFKHVSRKWQLIASDYERRKKNGQKTPTPYSASPKFWDWCESIGHKKHDTFAMPLIAKHPAISHHMQRLHSIRFPIDFRRIMRVAIESHNSQVVGYLKGIINDFIPYNPSTTLFSEHAILAIQHKFYDFFQGTVKYSEHPTWFGALELPEERSSFVYGLFEPAEIIDYTTHSSIGRHTAEFIRVYLTHINPAYKVSMLDIEYALCLNDISTIRLMISRMPEPQWRKINIHNTISYELYKLIADKEWINFDDGDTIGHLCKDDRILDDIVNSSMVWTSSFYRLLHSKILEFGSLHSIKENSDNLDDMDDEDVFLTIFHRFSSADEILEILQYFVEVKDRDIVEYSGIMWVLKQPDQRQITEYLLSIPDLITEPMFHELRNFALEDSRTDLFEVLEMYFHQRFDAGSDLNDYSVERFLDDTDNMTVESLKFVIRHYGFPDYNKTSWRNILQAPEWFELMKILMPRFSTNDFFEEHDEIFTQIGRFGPLAILDSQPFADAIKEPSNLFDVILGAARQDDLEFLRRIYTDFTSYTLVDDVTDIALQNGNFELFQFMYEHLPSNFVIRRKMNNDFSYRFLIAYGEEVTLTMLFESVRHEFDEFLKLYLLNPKEEHIRRWHSVEQDGVTYYRQNKYRN